MGGGMGGGMGNVGRSAALDGGISGAISGALNGALNPGCLHAGASSFGLPQASHPQFGGGCADPTASMSAAAMSAAYGHALDDQARSMRSSPEAMPTDGILGGESEADAFHRAAVLLSANLGGGGGRGE